jgi:hypothetical protein
MYCPQCGGANDDTTKYCSTCGYDMEEYRRQWQQGDSPSPEQQGELSAGMSRDGQVQSAGSQQPAPQSNQAPQPYQAPATYQAPYQAGSQQNYPPPYQPQPPYQQPYQTPQPYGYGNIPKIPSYMGWAIVTLILCFWPTGIVAVVYASQVGNKLAVGDFAGAKESSRKAKLWCWITFGIALAGVAIAILIAILAAVSFSGSVY